MIARSYEEAQAQRAVEIAEISFDELEVARWQLAQLVSQPGGEEYLAVYERVNAEFLAAERQMARINEARALAAQPPPKALSKRSSRGRRAAV